MHRLKLTLAAGYYDHMTDLVTGRVTAKGIDLTCLQYSSPSEIFLRFIVYRDFDVSEISMAKYVALRSQGDDSLVAIPVFPSRVARHSSLYVRRDGKVQSPADLRGVRIGLPEWAQTAAVYTRGMLMHQHGFDLAAVEWLQAGVDKPGRAEKVASKMPPGVHVTACPDKCLSDMLVSGEIDVIMAAHTPACFESGHPNIRRLFENSFEVEQAFVRDTGIFPIMHTVAIRKEILEQNPWVATNLYTAFEEARRLSVERVFYVGSLFPVPWLYEHAKQARAVFGKEFFPYGVAPNRKTLEAFLAYAYEQGVCHRQLAVEELFPKQVQRL